jgi:DNA-binding CsgD family transcriptional regulator
MTIVDRTTGKLDLLTQSERECLRMVAQHMRSKEIARERGTSPYTVNRQIENAIKKLGAADRHDAARIWLLEDPALGIPNGSSYDTLGIVNSLASGSLHEATEARRNDQSEFSPHGHDQLHLDATGRAAEGTGGNAGSASHGPTPGVGIGEAVPLSGGTAPAQRNHENGGLRVGSGLHAILSGQQGLSKRSWVVVFVLSTFLGALLLAGALSAISASFMFITELKSH